LCGRAGSPGWRGGSAGWRAGSVGPRAAGADFHCASGQSSSGPPHVVQRSPSATMVAALAL
jgi:hypothetical protein